MGFKKSPQGKIGHDIPIIPEDGLIFFKQIFDILQSSCGVQKDWLMAKKDGHAAPLPFKKPLQVDLGRVMGIHDEAVHPDFEEMVHPIGDDRTSSDLQERLRAAFR